MVGVFTLILPLPIVVDSFEGCYKNRLWRNEVAHKKDIRNNNDRETDDGNEGGLEVIKKVILRANINFINFIRNI